MLKFIRMWILISSPNQLDVGAVNITAMSLQLNIVASVEKVCATVAQRIFMASIIAKNVSPVPLRNNH